MKGTTYKKPTLYSATRTLQRFFSGHPDSNSVTKEDMLASWDRNKPEHEKSNEGWLSGKLTALYAHSLVRPIYSYDPWKKLERIELTPKGKGALDRDDAPASVDEPRQDAPPLRSADSLVDLTIEDILTAIPKINERLVTHQIKVVFIDKEVQSAKQA